MNRGSSRSTAHIGALNREEKSREDADGHDRRTLGALTEERWLAGGAMQGRSHGGHFTETKHLLSGVNDGGCAEWPLSMRASVSSKVCVIM